jgi:hypothetical protein
MTRELFLAFLSTYIPPKFQCPKNWREGQEEFEAG